MPGYELIDWLASVFRRHGTSAKPVIFRTELGDYDVLDILEQDGATVVLLLEAGK